MHDRHLFRWIAGAFLGLLALHLGLARDLPGPILYEDTLGYLAIARDLAGWEPRPLLNAPNGFYHFGYPLLLAPLYLLLGASPAVFRGALVLDSVLASLQVLLLYALGRSLFGLGRGFALGAAGVAALYPAWLLQSSFAWSESLFAFLFSLWGLLAVQALRRGGLWIVVFGAAGSFLYAVHPRGLGLAVVTPIALALWGLRGHTGRAWSAAGISATCAVFAATRWLNAHFFERLWLTRPKAHEGNVLGLLLDPAVWLGALPARVAGQVWYLLAATLGLCAVGAFVLAALAVRRLRRGGIPEEDGTRSRVAALILVGAAAVLFASVTVMLPAERSDHFVYGRYNEALLGPFLIAGLAGLAGAETTRGARLARLGGAGALLALLGFFLPRILPAAGLATPPMPLNVLGVLVWNREAALDLTRTTLQVLAAMAVLTALVLASRRATLVALAAFFAVSAVSVEQRLLLPFCRFWSGMATLQETLRPLAPLSRNAVSYERSGLSTYGFNAYQFWLDRVRFRLFDSAAGEAPQDPLVIAGRAWEAPGFRKVAAETGMDQVLWVAPGPLQQDLERRGMLIPLETTAPLPPEALRSRLERIGKEGSLEAGPGETLRLRFRVGHAGRGAVWLPLAATSSGTGAVRLAARWFRAGETLPVEPGGFRGELPRVLGPGDAAEVEIAVPTQALEPGSYVLEIGLVQENVRWFAEAGDSPLRIPVEIR